MSTRTVSERSADCDIDGAWFAVVNARPEQVGCEQRLPALWAVRCGHCRRAYVGMSALCVATLAALATGFGGPADAVLGGLPAAGRTSATLPSAAYWLRLDTAAAQGRIGETALLALAILGPEGTMNTSPYLMPSVLRALRGVGLETTAQALAVETAIHAGL